MRPKMEMLAELKTMLRDVFAARTEGAAYARLARAHGYVDGYMRALMEAGVVTKEELLAIVAREREAAYGPATRGVELDHAAALDGFSAACAPRRSRRRRCSSQGWTKTTSPSTAVCP